MRISDWSSDVCSSDLQPGAGGGGGGEGADGTDDHHALEAEVEDAGLLHHQLAERGEEQRRRGTDDGQQDRSKDVERSEEHTSELQSLMRISYAVFCLKKKTKHSGERRIRLEY